MTASKGLAALKASQLKYAAFYMGLATTGTKPELEHAIRNCAFQHRLEPSNEARIVSVDMGIKNLGICVLDASKRTDNESAPLEVIEWKTVDVFSNLTAQSGIEQDQLIGMTSAVPLGDKRRRKVTKRSAIHASLFRPSLLSKTAFGIAKDILHSYKPSHILIERQRFRSGGASAVQEWTLRVNMLESMLWACLETMRKQANQHLEHHEFPSVEELPMEMSIEDWMVDKPLVTETKKRIEKKDKIAVVRSWLSQVDTSGPNSRAPTLEFDEDARKTADAFMVDVKQRKSFSSITVSSSEEGPLKLYKLDDLADSLLQAVAWVRWTDNRREIRGMIERSEGRPK
ncbi:hypothetical protein LTR37_015157 [Vermiconidia calcicola]|uniref:Uncharacterized protein n=1 Tax=Vermiconidia calcicola TaxID=1690605 RepID=A0ACC3MRK8_9PEZI|nr:hypothetical protein LTR37_015157 [Vermiconidia calcicola]